MFHLFVSEGNINYATYCGVDFREELDREEEIDTLTVYEWLVGHCHEDEEPCKTCLEKVCPLKMLALTEI